MNREMWTIFAHARSYFLSDTQEGGFSYSDIGTTLNIYSHVIPSLQQEAVSRLDGLLAR